MPADILNQLPALKWRELQTPPYDLLSFEFKNDLSPRRVPYLDGDIHDFTGRVSFPMTARLFFLNTIGQGQLFPDLWEQWKANLDGEVGELMHPVLGPLQARIEGAKGTLQSSTRAGIIIDITWIETITNPAFGDFLGVLSVDPATVSAAADISAAHFGIKYPTGAPGSPTSLLGAWNAVRGALFSLSLAAEQQINQVLGNVGTMIEACDAITDPLVWVARDNLLSFWQSLRNQIERVRRAARPTRRRVLDRDTPLDAFAASVGNTLSDVLSLNLFAIRSPFVPRGTTMTFYA